MFSCGAVDLVQIHPFCSARQHCSGHRMRNMSDVCDHLGRSFLSEELGTAATRSGPVGNSFISII